MAKGRGTDELGNIVILYFYIILLFYYYLGAAQLHNHYQEHEHATLTILTGSKKHLFEKPGGACPEKAKLP